MKESLNPSLLLHAHAKINLFLHVGPYRPDGNHNVETIYQEVSLHDTLRCRGTDGPVRIRVSTPAIPQDKSNLVVKALELLRQKMGIRKGMEVYLKKRIPVGAGLGGGSSDAAAALRAGWALWRRKPLQSLSFKGKVPKILRACARKLGADVPFFLRGGTALGQGIGDRLTPLPNYPVRWLVLVYPRIHVSTKLAYQWIDNEFPRPKRMITGILEPSNTFETVILPRFRPIERVHRSLVRLGCQQVMMSGSGSSVFGFVKNRKEGKKICRHLAKNPWDIFLIKTLRRD